MIRAIFKLVLTKTNQQLSAGNKKQARSSNMLNFQRMFAFAVQIANFSLQKKKQKNPASLNIP